MKKIVFFLLSNLNLLYKIFAVLCTTILILLIFPDDKKTTYNYVEGGFWNSNDLYAPFDFAVLKNQEEIDRDIASAKKDALLFFIKDTTIQKSIISNIIHRDFPLSQREKNEILRLVNHIYTNGYLQHSDELKNTESLNIVVLSGNIGETRTYDDFMTYNKIQNLLQEKLHSISNSATIQEILLDSILKPNIVYDKTRTSLEEDSRLSQISYTSGLITTGQLIISKGEFITSEKAKILKSLEKENDEKFEQHYSQFNHKLGLFLLIIISFSALFLFLGLIKHDLLKDNKKVTFVLFIILLIAFMTAMIVRINSDWVLLVPLCIIPILMRIFFDMRVALYIHLVVTIIIGSLVPNSFEYIFYQLITGMMSIISVKNFERRSNFFVVSLIIFTTYSCIYIAGVLSQDTNLHNINLYRFVIFFCNALLTLLAYPLIYLFERIFGFTTDLALLEISSTNTKALRDLSNKAPGTFQHSVQVANISEDLINEIGGNSLLARVGALYHDIGKIQSPLFYTENQNSGFNPHIELDYQESAAIIIDHVRNGITLAKKYHLPEIVIDFIRTHHGTTKTSYFYNKQLLEYSNEPIDDSIFTYPGPKPYSRETAVVMLVDSVEAAIKSLKSPNKENINHLIDSIIEGKIKDDQFSNCNITFRDIDKIKQILKKKMLSIYHVRIAYPIVGTIQNNKTQ